MLSISLALRLACRVPIPAARLVASGRVLSPFSPRYFTTRANTTTCKPLQPTSLQQQHKQKQPVPWLQQWRKRQQQKASQAQLRHLRQQLQQERERMAEGQRRITEHEQRLAEVRQGLDELRRKWDEAEPRLRETMRQKHAADACLQLNHDLLDVNLYVREMKILPAARQHCQQAATATLDPAAASRSRLVCARARKRAHSLFDQANLGVDVVESVDAVGPRPCTDYYESPIRLNQRQLEAKQRAAKEIVSAAGVGLPFVVALRNLYYRDDKMQFETAFYDGKLEAMDA